MSTIALHIIAKDDKKELRDIITKYYEYVDQIDIAIDDQAVFENISSMAGELDKVNAYKYDWNEEEKKRNYPNFDDKRNFLVDKCKCDFYLRLDTDDEIVHPEKIRDIIDRADEKKVDIVSCYYDYSRDEWGNTHAAHYRETIVRNNKLYYWNKHIHENILPKNPRGGVPIVIDKQLSIRHHLDPAHAVESRERNLKFLLEEYEATKDNPDPRTMAYLGRMLASTDRLAEAKFFLEEHVKTSGWDEDRCVSWCYLAKIMDTLGKIDQSLACCYEAMNERPDFPDPYLAMHTAYFTKGEWAKAIHWGSIGLDMKRPDTFMLLDPASYTWRPAISMAHSYLMLGDADKAVEYFNIVKKYAPGLDWVKDNEKLFYDSVLHKSYVTKFTWMLEFLKSSDKEKLPKMFDVIPEELCRHDMLVRLRHQFTEPKVWGDNEIAIYCGQSFEDWAAPSVLKGIGGSEEAVIYLSRELIRLGHKVTVYCSCGDYRGEYDGVIYKEFFQFNPFDKFNTVIAWRGNIFGNISVKRSIVWLHDVPMPGLLPEGTENTFDKLIVLSDFHASLLPDYISKDKVYVSTNGIHLKDFSPKDIPKRNPHRIIYTSSHDRGIEHLFDMWGDVKKEVPDAELHLFYGWDVYDALVKKSLRTPELKNRLLAKMTQPGIFDHGRIGHKKLIKEYFKAGIYAYPCHFEEISCISAMKAQACGCTPVVTNYAALKETVKDGVLVEGKAGDGDTDERYKEALIKALKEQPKINVDASQFSWAKVAKKWHEDLLTQDLTHQKFNTMDEYKHEYSKVVNYEPPNFADGEPSLIPRYEGILGFCEEKKIKTLLDIGCADGGLCFLASNRGIEADGLEICPKANKFAEDYAQKNNYTCTFYKGTLEEVDIAQKYDVVSIQEVIEHVLDPKAFLEKANKFGKYVYITTPHKDGIFGEKNRDPHHLRYYDKKSMKELIGDKKIHHLRKIMDGNILLAIYEND